MINIFDVSNIVYSGHYGSVANSKPKTVCGFPTGGLFKLFGMIASNIYNSSIALAFDGDSIIKKELLPEYKANRLPNYSVYAEIELAKELLAMCNIPILYDSKSEADDFIYSLCYNIALLSSEMEEVTIYSDDRDLSCCVTPSTCIHNVTAQGKSIDFKNFSQRVVKNTEIPYNSILLYKLFYGDVSDNYSGKSFTGITFDVLFSELDAALEPLIQEGVACNIHYADFDVLQNIVDNTEYLSDDIKAELLKAARIVYPFKVQVGDMDITTLINKRRIGEMKNYETYRAMNIFSVNDINIAKFRAICKTLGVPIHGASAVDKDKEIMDLLYLRGKELSSGDFMVAKAKQKEHREEPTTLLTMEFPDEIFKG